MNWVNYQNGNYRVIINTINGTKIRYNDSDFFCPSRPESIDVKVTDLCYHNCPFCHENSSPHGQNADLYDIIYFAQSLPEYCEIALGGGNLMEDIYFTEQVLNIFKKHKAIVSITVRQDDFIKYIDIINKWHRDHLIYGIGISLIYAADKEFWQLYHTTKIHDNCVIHVIAGILTKQDIFILQQQSPKVLILGYKKIKRGKNFYIKNINYINNNIAYLKKHLIDFINSVDICSFDNLALQQLDVKSQIAIDIWDLYYMGNDGTTTFFVDLVQKCFAKSSTDSLRFYINNKSVMDMFNVIRKENEMVEDYFFEEDYPDCVGEELYYSKQPGCLTCLYKSMCSTKVENQNSITRKDKHES